MSSSSNQPAPSSNRAPSQTPTVVKKGGRLFRWSVLAILAAGIVTLVVIKSGGNASSQAAAGSGRSRSGAGRAVPVAVESTHLATLTLRQPALGTVVTISTVTVRSRVDGQLQKLHFTEGTMIKAGDPIADIDPRPYEVSKAQAEATTARDRALLENAKVDLQRFQTLLAQDSISKQQTDTQVALVHQYEAAVKLDEAAVQSAALQLEYAHITAPISGRLGLRLVDLGNMVHASDSTGLAVITQLQPISIVFSIPQDVLPKVLKHFQAGDTMPVEAYDRDGKTLLATGRLVTIDNQVDLTTGTVKLRAEFANETMALFPNQFVNVQLQVEQLQDVVAAPSAAVQRGTSGNYVFVVEGDSTAVLRQVEIGVNDRGQIAISKGLKAGDRVVVDGVDKLRDGSAIEVTAPQTSAAGQGAGSAAGGSGERGAGKRWRDGAGKDGAAGSSGQGGAAGSGDPSRHGPRKSEGGDRADKSSASEKAVGAERATASEKPAASDKASTSEKQ